MAHVNSEERFLTLGCGHTVLICKLAAQPNAKTSQKEISDDNGYLNVYKLKQNAEFKAMIEEGWEWTIVPAAVDEYFPMFAKVAQKALNTANHVGIEMGELETQITLSDLIDDPGFTQNPVEASCSELCRRPLCSMCKVFNTFASIRCIIWGVQEPLTLG